MDAIENVIPNGDGVISLEEIKNWDPQESPIHIQNQLRKLDLSGNLNRPVIIGQGKVDVLVAPKDEIAYKQLVEETIGINKAESLLRLYVIPNFRHTLSGVFNPFVDEALDALDQWVDFIESGDSKAKCPEIS